MSARFFQSGWIMLALIVGLCLLPIEAKTQPTSTTGTTDLQYVAQQWTVADGLPVNAVNDMVQTDDGYLWLATYDGLVRFDGAQFTVYQSGNHEGLPSSRILDVKAVGNDVWLLTESQHLVELSEGTFRTVSLPDVSMFYLPQNPSDDQTIWVGTVTGLFKIQEDGTAQPVQERYIQGNITALHQTQTGELWIGTSRHGVYRYTGGEQPYHFTNQDTFIDTRINSIASRADSTVLIAGGNGGWAWNDGELRSIPSASGEDVGVAFQIQQDHNENFWFRTDAGIYQYEDGMLVHQADHSGQPVIQSRESLIQVDAVNEGTHVWVNAVNHILQQGQSILSTSSNISQMLQDHEGGLWVATTESGIYQLRPSQISTYGSDEGVGSGNIYPILQRHDGSIWLGSLGGGVTRMTQEDTTTVIPRKGDSDLSNVWSLHETRDSTLWIGGSRLCRWEDGQCATPDETGLSDYGRVLAIHEDASQKLWVGSIQGLYRHTSPSDTGPAAWFQYTPENSGLSHRIVRTIHESEDGTLWFGTNGGGVSIYQDGVFYPFTEDDGLPSNLVRDIYQDPEGVFWIATEDRGLARVEWPAEEGVEQALNDASITTLTTEEGLFNNGIHRIIEDDEHRMWMSTNRGIFWVHRSALNAVAKGEQNVVPATRYTERDGMRNREANGGIQPAGMRSDDGRIWFPTQAGAAVIDPTATPLANVPPYVHIERVVTADSIYRPVDGLVELPSHERNFDIEYTGISFVNPDQMQFAYQLEGVDNDWRVEIGQRSAGYTNIPTGSHTFSMRASNGNDVWNEEAATLTVIVQPRFYETWWFLVLLVFGSAGGIWALYSMRVRALKQRKRELKSRVQENTKALRHEKQKTKSALQLSRQKSNELERINASKSRFFARITHEFRTPLTLTLGPVDHILESDDLQVNPAQHEQLRIAQRNALRLARLVDQLHDLAKLETGAMTFTPEEADLVAFASDCVWAFQGVAEQRGISMDFEADVETHSFFFDPSKMEKIIANLITNALQATQRGDKIQVRLQTQLDRENDAQIIFTVQDNGTGMPAEQLQYLQAKFQANEDNGWTHNNEFIGIGLNLLDELVGLHGGYVDVQSQEGEGTTFTVHIPNQATNPEAAPTRAPGSAMSGRRPLQLAQRTLMLERESAPPPLDYEARSEAEHSTTSDPKSEDNRPLVLIVEDNEDFRSYLRWHLEPTYRIVEAKNSTEGYKAARSILPDVAIIDITMPGQDGIALCRSIKQHPDINQIPVVLLTALENPDTRIEGYEAGSDAYLTKPFNGEELQAILKNLIESRQKLRDMQAKLPDNSSMELRNVEDDESLSFQERLEQIIQARLPDPDFSVSDLANEMALSPSQLRRQTSTHYDRTPVQLIRYRRLQAASELLVSRPNATIGEIAYAVGFNSQSYFSRAFKDAYSATPSQFRSDARDANNDSE